MNNVYVISAVNGNYEMLNKIEQQLNEVDDGPKTYVLMPNAFGGPEADKVLQWILNHNWMDTVDKSGVVLVQGDDETEFCEIYDTITDKNFSEIEEKLRQKYFPGKKEIFSPNELEKIYFVMKSAQRYVFIDMYPESCEWHILICVVDEINKKDNEVRGRVDINFIIELATANKKKALFPNAITYCSEQILLPDSLNNITALRVNDACHLNGLERVDSLEFFCDCHKEDKDTILNEWNLESLEKLYHKFSTMEAMARNNLIDNNYRESFHDGTQIFYEEAYVVSAMRASEIRTR